MNVREILKKHLKENNYDGLCNPDAQCGCGVDDIALCDWLNPDDCESAYKNVCKECGNEIFALTKDRCTCFECMD